MNIKKNKIIGPKAYIDLDVCRSNLSAIKKRIGGRKLLCVIKANGYGHGAVQIAKAIENFKNVQFAVFSFEEALELRNANIQNDILVFSRMQSQYIKLADENNITLNISAIEDIEEINSYFLLNGSCPRYHLKFDTGMTRLGFDLTDASMIYGNLNKNIVKYLEGVYTHFATADEGNLSYAIRQLNNFKKVVEKADEYGIKFKNIHCSNSGAIINIKDSYFNMVRVGMLLYGALPSNEVKDNIGIKPVMSFYGSIVNVRKVKKGTHISYGGVYKSTSETNIGVIQTGFADGFPRPWYNDGYVNYKGKNYKIAGRVCMDQLMIDFGETIPIVGEDVLFFGENEFGKIKVETIAENINSTAYVLLTSIGGRTKYIYVNQ